MIFKPDWDGPRAADALPPPRLVQPSCPVVGPLASALSPAERVLAAGEGCQTGPRELVLVLGQSAPAPPPVPEGWIRSWRGQLLPRPKSPGPRPPGEARGVPAGRRSGPGSGSSGS